MPVIFDKLGKVHRGSVYIGIYEKNGTYCTMINQKEYRNKDLRYLLNLRDSFGIKTKKRSVCSG